MLAGWNENAALRVNKLAQKRVDRGPGWGLLLTRLEYWSSRLDFVTAIQANVEADQPPMAFSRLLKERIRPFQGTYSAF